MNGFALLPPNTNINGTSLTGYIDISPAALVRRFGQPGISDEYKISGEYIFRGPGGSIFTVYDWKSTSLYSSNFISPGEIWAREMNMTLHIGGNLQSIEHLVAFQNWLREEVAPEPEAAATGSGDLLRRVISEASPLVNPRLSEIDWDVVATRFVADYHAGADGTATPGPEAAATGYHDGTATPGLAGSSDWARDRHSQARAGAKVLRGHLWYWFGNFPSRDDLWSMTADFRDHRVQQFQYEGELNSGFPIIEVALYPR